VVTVELGSNMKCVHMWRQFSGEFMVKYLRYWNIYKRNHSIGLEYSVMFLENFYLHLHKAPICCSVSLTASGGQFGGWQEGNINLIKRFCGFG
jgi:hypothetical protein